MTTFVDTRIVCLTSQSATTKKNSTYLSDLFYGFGSIYQNSPDIIHRQVQLLNAQIPYSFYVINYTNQIFRLKIGSGSATNYTIPVGNYTATSLITALKTAVNDATLTIVFSSINGKLTFGHTSALTIYNDFQYSIGTILGLNPNVNSASSTSITLPNPLNLLGIKTLQIRSQNLVMNNVSSIEGGQTILLANVPVSAVPFGMIDYVDQGNIISITNQDLDDILIELIDGETGNYVNMNGQDWCMTLAFHLTRVWTPPKALPPPPLQGTDGSLANPPLQGLANPPLQGTDGSLANPPLQGTDGSLANPPFNLTPDEQQLAFLKRRV